MKPVQVFYRLYYMLRRRFGSVRVFDISNVTAPDSGIDILEFSPLPTSRKVYCDSKFTFLNVASPLLDWNDRSHGHLWAYNLNYFDFLLQDEMTHQTANQLLNDFIDNLRSDMVGMEAYPTSLRCINWVKYLSKNGITDPKIDAALYWQYERLLQNLEYHLLGNHLLENAFALLFGAYYFQEEAWYLKAKTLLVEQLEEQVLNDGAHFELSPMYQQILFGRLLDSVNLVCHNSWQKDGLPDYLYTKAASMGGWLQEMTFSDGTIPLFNDSSFGIAIDSSELFAYAKKLGVDIGAKHLLGVSGYRKHNTATYEVIADVGNIEAHYIPGHSHNDFGSFVLHADKPLIVDTGVSTYETNERRLQERRTKAHNTVEIPDYEQNHVWQSFRVAERGETYLMIDEPGRMEAVFTYPDAKTKHSRKFRFDENVITIEDQLNVPDNVTARFHIHPDISIERIDTGVLMDGAYRMHFDQCEAMSINTYHYAPEFNILVDARVVEVTFRKTLRTRIEL
jgi:hypothetical protein